MLRVLRIQIQVLMNLPVTYIGCAVVGRTPPWLALHRCISRSTRVFLLLLQDIGPWPRLVSPKALSWLACFGRLLGLPAARLRTSWLRHLFWHGDSCRSSYHRCGCGCVLCSCFGRWAPRPVSLNCCCSGDCFFIYFGCSRHWCAQIVLSFTNCVMCSWRSWRSYAPSLLPSLVDTAMIVARRVVVGWDTRSFWVKFYRYARLTATAVTENCGFCFTPSRNSCRRHHFLHFFIFFLPRAFCASSFSFFAPHVPIIALISTSIWATIWIWRVVVITTVAPCCRELWSPTRCCEIKRLI